MFTAPVLLFLLSSPLSLRAEVGETDLNDLSEQQNAIKINKCCEPNELMIDSKCRIAEQYNKSKYLHCQHIRGQTWRASEAGYIKLSY